MNAVFIKFSNGVNITRTSQTMPLRVPQSEPLGPNKTIDMDVDIKWDNDLLK